MIQNIDFSKIPVFLAAAECLNFTEAADRVFMTQSSLSKAIAAFEGDIGFPLFIRSNRKVSLTPEGAYLYQTLSDIMIKIGDAVSAAHRIHAGHTGAVRIGISGYLAQTPAFEKIGFHFSMAYPDYEIELQHMPYTELRRSLIDEKVDIILYNQHDLAKLHGLYVLTISHGSAVVLCNSRTVEYASGKKLSIQDFRDAKFVCLSPSQVPSYSEYLHNCCKAYGFTPNITRYCSSIMEVLHYVNCTNHVTILDRTIIPKDASGCGFVPIPHIDGMEHTDTVLAWKEDNKSAPLKYFTGLAEECVCSRANLI